MMDRWSSIIKIPTKKPTDLVRDSTLKVVQRSTHVTISNDKTRILSKELSTSDGIGGLNRKTIGWRECGWHYSMDSTTNGPLTCQYVFVLDTLNFCFWPIEGFEYSDLALSLKFTLESDPKAFDASNLRNASESTIMRWFNWDSCVPQLEERAKKIQELGEALDLHFDGLAENMVKCAAGSAVNLIRLLIAVLPGFRDEAVHGGSQVFFYKRAQILVADLWAAYGYRSKESIYGFTDIQELTMFADYRVPQILEHLGILRYSVELKEKIKSKFMFHAGCEEEIEIRAATIQAVEQIKTYVQEEGSHLSSIEIDWLLWHLGENMKKDILPHHRVLSIFY